MNCFLCGVVESEEMIVVEVKEIEGGKGKLCFGCMGENWEMREMEMDVDCLIERRRERREEYSGVSVERESREKVRELIERFFKFVREME